MASVTTVVCDSSRFSPLAGLVLDDVCAAIVFSFTVATTALKNVDNTDASPLKHRITNLEVFAGVDHISDNVDAFRTFRTAIIDTEVPISALFDVVSFGIDLSHITRKDYEKVYEPAEDTFLLLDALEKEEHELKRQNPIVCLEIGSGSGCVSSFIRKILGPSVLYLATDINPHACRCTSLTGLQNNVDIDVVNGSFATPFYPRLCHNVDVLLFNPPYVPTTDEEAYGGQTMGDIGGSWAGGLEGMKITNILLDQVERLLSPKGRFYLVALKQNNIRQIIESMEKLYGLNGEIVMERRAHQEYLYVLRFTRIPDNL